jgi:hypothetical protein
MPLPRGDAAEEGRVWAALVRGADSLGSSTQVVEALAAAAKAKIKELELPSSVSDLLGALTHTVAHSLSLSRRILHCLCACRPVASGSDIVRRRRILRRIFLDCLSSRTDYFHPL